MRTPLKRCMQAGSLVAAVVLLATAAGAQTASEGLSPTLANIKKTHVVRLGYRESSPPFSFLDQANRPIGYSLELCEAIVDEIGIEVDDADLRIEYVKVTSDDRIPAVVQNKIDLECGSTTANAERGKQVAFSPLMFVAGTKLMVPKTSTISAPKDLQGKTVVVTKGTTNEQAMHAVDKKFTLGLNIVTAADHEQSYQMLVDGKADAFATDDILLYGLIARHKAQDKFRVAGEYLSYDPYGIMFRKGEPQLTAVVERTFRKLGSNRDLIPLYNKWFVARLPTGEKLNVRSITNGLSRACPPARNSTSRSRRNSRKASGYSTIRRATATTSGSIGVVVMAVTSSRAMTIIRVSSSAKADDPVFRDGSVRSQMQRHTGYPAFAGYDRNL